MPAAKLVTALIAAAIAMAAAISLGNWQMRRGDAKLALQAQADEVARASSAEIAPTLSAIEDAAGRVPLKVRANGVFDPAGTVYLDNRMLDGVAGYYVITPLLMGEGLPAVLIDRGWKARDMQDRTRVSAATPLAGRVSVEGLAVPRPSALFELGDKGEQRVPGIWQNLDYAAYERATGRKVARFVIQQRAEGQGGSAADGLRREWARPASGVEKHRGYALQWYSLAALIAALTAYFGWKSWRAR